VVPAGANPGVRIESGRARIQRDFLLISTVTDYLVVVPSLLAFLMVFFRPRTAAQELDKHRSKSGAVLLR
jgi:hypothetical protein